MKPGRVKGANVAEKSVFVGFGPWRRNVPDWFAGHESMFASRNPLVFILSGWPLRLLVDRPTVYVWGFKYPAFLKSYARLLALPFRHVEDGFVRSISLGAGGALPASLTVDSRTPYFDARTPSDLETLLASHDFAGDPQLMLRARRVMTALKESRLSKYNLGSEQRAEDIYGPKVGRRVLVIGQVEDDASIRYGCSRKITNNDLVRLAVSENEGAEVIYKPHPDVLYGNRPARSSPSSVAGICRILDEDISPSASLRTIDHVYTITSLMGFEALLADKRVTCFGAPFYAGWGLTDDRQPCPRRNRQLTIEEVFAGAYLLYSRYFDPETGRPIDLEAVIDRLTALRARLPETGRKRMEEL